MRHRAEEQHLKTQIAIKRSRPFIGKLTTLGSFISDHNTPSAFRDPPLLLYGCTYARASVALSLVYQPLLCVAFLLLVARFKILYKS